MALFILSVLLGLHLFAWRILVSQFILAYVDSNALKLPSIRPLLQRAWPDGGGICRGPCMKGSTAGNEPFVAFCIAFAFLGSESARFRPKPLVTNGLREKGMAQKWLSDGSKALQTRLVAAFARRRASHPRPPSPATLLRARLHPVLPAVWHAPVSGPPGFWQAAGPPLAASSLRHPSPRALLWPPPQLSPPPPRQPAEHASCPPRLPNSADTPNNVVLCSFPDRVD